MGDVIQKKYLEIFEASYMMPGARVSLANNTYVVFNVMDNMGIQLRQLSLNLLCLKSICV